MGRHIYFIGSNEEAALLSGISVDRIKVIIFTLCSTLAAFEAVIETSRMSTAQPAAGIGYELSAIGAVIIGGASLLGGSGTILRHHSGRRALRYYHQRADSLGCLRLLAASLQRRDHRFSRNAGYLAA